MDKRSGQIDAAAAAADADWVESDAAAAIEFAAWSVTRLG